MRLYLDLIKSLSHIPLPFTIVDMEAFDQNIEKVRAMVNASHKTFRIATKSLRVPALLERIISKGAPCIGFMCYSAREAEFLHSLGMNDFLIAYPTFQKSDLLALRRIHETGAKVRLVVDCQEGVSSLSESMQGTKLPFEVIVDVDASFKPFHKFFGVHLGVRRSPIHSPENLHDFLEILKTYPSLKFTGLMMYEAQVSGLGDRNPFRWYLNRIVTGIRYFSLLELKKRRKAMLAVAESAGFKVEIFNGGGTGSLNFTLSDPSINEVAVGSAFLCPHLFDYYSNIRFLPACFFATQVVRRPHTQIWTCQGGGYTASGEPGWDKVPIPYYPKGLKLIKTEGCGEVQTPLICSQENPFHFGDFVFFRHAKAGELAERFNEYLIVSQGKVIDHAKTYRGYGQVFY